MKKKKIFRPIPLILVLFMILSAFGLLPSCGDKNSGNSNNNNAKDNAGAQDNNIAADNQNNPDGPDNTDGAEPAKITYDVPEMDCGGYVFTVLDRDGYLGLHWITIDMFAESENGEPINDAVFRRNRLLEEKFNISIAEIRKEDVLSFAQKIIQSGSDDFDVMYPHMQQAATMIQKGQVLDLFDMQSLDFNKPWWNKLANDSMTVGKKLYGAAGDITTTTNDATWTVLFNKDLNQQYALDDPYQLVKDGKWTLDVLYDNSRTATKDLDGDGVMNPEDQ